MVEMADILVQNGTASAGGMAPPASTRMSARLTRVQGHTSPVNLYTICTYVHDIKRVLCTRACAAVF